MWKKFIKIFTHKTNRFIFISIILFVVFSFSFISINFNELSLFGKKAKAQADITTGLVGHWKFDEGAGTTANDSSGNGNTGTLNLGTSTPNWTAGKINNSLTFDGYNDKVNAGSAASLDDLGPMTISAWINPKSLGKNNYGRIVAKDSNVNNTGFWTLNLSSSNVIIFVKNYSTTNLVRKTSNNSFSLDSWQHITLTWDGTENASNVRIYVNGTETVYQSAVNGVGAKNSDATQNLHIGNTGSGTLTFDGLIDDVRVYNRALTSIEVQELYNYIGDPLPPVDTTPPVLSSGSPTGALPSGTTQTTLSVEATDASSPVSCKYSQTLGTAYSSMTETLSTANGTTFTATVTGLTNGTNYNYYVRCSDALGNANTSDYTISFSVSAPAGDTTPPTVSITSPANGTIVSGTITVLANATDNVGISGVQFKLDTTTNLGTEDTTSPYSYSLNTATITDGSHTLIAVARDTSNNYATSSIITVTINNASPPPPDTTPPSIPTGLTVTVISSTQINLSWSASTDNVGVTGYKVYRCAGSACAPTVQIATSAVNSYSNTGLTASTAYTYAVSAYDAAGNESGKSLASSATTNTQTVISLDKYGGYANLPVGSATGFFRVAKTGDQYTLVTPEGNAYWFVGPALVSTGNPGKDPDTGLSYVDYIKNKYGVTYPVWPSEIKKRLLSWGFNGLGMYESGFVRSYPDPFRRQPVAPLMPHFNTRRFASNAMRCT